MTQLTMEEIKRWVETPLTSLMKIYLFLKEWVKINNKEITSLLCKVEVHLENARFEDIQEVSKWRFALGNP